MNNKTSIIKFSAYCPECEKLNDYEYRNIFKNTGKKQIVNPGLKCRFCQNEFLISLSNKKTEPNIFFGTGEIKF